MTVAKPEVLSIDGIPLTLKWSKRRKTIGLKVDKGAVSVSAPWRSDKGEIARFVQSKKRWLEKHLVLQQSSLQPERRFKAGDSLPYLGEPLTLSYTGDAGRLVKVRLSAVEVSSLCISGVQADTATMVIRRAVEAWYLSEAYAYLSKRVAVLADVMGVAPQGLKVRHYKTRWGSCNSRGELQFNWLLIMAPREIVDYVVVHELAHLKHFNHSPKFWQLVAQYIPDWQSHRQWLKINGQGLGL